MFRAPATTNGAICLSSRSRPPQHFASHLPRSFLRPSPPVVLPLFLLPLLASLRRLFLSATSSSSWSVGRSTFRPLCRLHHHSVSSSLSAFLFFFLFSFSAGSTSLYLRRRIDSSSSSSFLFGVHHLRAPLSDRRSILLTRMCNEKLAASAKNARHYFAKLKGLN